MANNRCASCAHWEYADQVTPEWDSLPLTHLFAWGECALLSSPQPVQPIHSYRDPESFDTHWTFGCIYHRAPDAE